LGEEPVDRAAADDSLKGRLIYYARPAHDGENAGLYSYDFETRKFEQVLKDVNPDSFCRASPDGKSFALAEASAAGEIASIIRPDGRTEVSKDNARLFWAPDGRRVIVSEWTEDPLASKTWRMNPDGTGRVQLAVPTDELVVDWSPDGRRLLIVRRKDDPTGQLGPGPNKPMFLRHADGTGPSLLLEKNPGGSGLGRFSPDSRSVAYVRINHWKREYGVRVIDVATCRERRILDGDGHDDPDGNLCWSPDGKYLAVRMMDWKKRDVPGPAGHLEIVDLQGRRIRWLGIPQRVPVPCNWL
jgi:Tol biopolymer transport system component